MGERRWPLTLLALGATLAGLAFAWAWSMAQRLPEGPVTVVWDKEACAECRMHIGDPSFAAQLQLTDGRVLDFDDPGCLFTWLAGHEDALHATWFHHHEVDRWLSADEVGFVSVEQSPMGFRLAAVGAAVPGARRFAAVRAEFRGCRERAGRER